MTDGPDLAPAPIVEEMALDNYVEHVAEDPERVPWQIDSLGDAEWAMSKYREAETSLGELQDQADEWHHRVDTWLHDASTGIRRKLHFFNDRLTAYALRARHERNEKTTKLPSGDVATREHKPSITVTDGDAFTDWAYANDRADLLRTSVSPAVLAIKESLAFVDKGDHLAVIDPDSGEIVPGVEAKLGGVSASIKPG